MGGGLDVDVVMRVLSRRCLGLENRAKSARFTTRGNAAGGFRARMLHHHFLGFIGVALGFLSEVASQPTWVEFDLWTLCS